MPPPPLLWVSPSGQEQRSLEMGKKALESPMKEQDMMVSMNQVLRQPTEVNRVTNEIPLQCSAPEDNTTRTEKLAQDIVEAKGDGGSKVQGKTAKRCKEPTQVAMACKQVEVEKSNLRQSAALKVEKETESPTLSTDSGPLSDSGQMSVRPKKTVLPALENLAPLTVQPSAPPPAVVSQELSQVYRVILTAPPKKF